MVAITEQAMSDGEAAIARAEQAEKALAAANAFLADAAKAKAGTQAELDRLNKAGESMVEVAEQSMAKFTAANARADQVGPGRYCSSHHRLPCNPRNEGKKCVT